jgi:hypothetical protein
MLVGEARERGIAPDSPEAAQVIDRLLAGADPGRREYILERLSAGTDSQADRYRQLLAIINGQPPPPSPVPDFEWLLTTMRIGR